MPCVEAFSLAGYELPGQLSSEVFGRMRNLRILVRHLRLRTAGARMWKTTRLVRSNMRVRQAVLVHMQLESRHGCRCWIVLVLVADCRRISHQTTELFYVKYNGPCSDLQVLDGADFGNARVDSPLPKLAHLAWRYGRATSFPFALTAIKTAGVLIMRGVACLEELLNGLQARLDQVELQQVVSAARLTRGCVQKLRCCKRACCSDLVVLGKG